MITVNTLLALLGACDHAIIIYDKNVRDYDAVDDGDLLYDSDYPFPSKQIPSEILDMQVMSFDLEDDLFRIWVNGRGIPNFYGVPYQR